jgi:FtsP/CotA-like multicopper oxidase with cupredoxin domain
MTQSRVSRRNFLKTAGAIAGTSWLYRGRLLYGEMAVQDATDTKADYTLKIATIPLELSPNRIVSVATYNGQFPRPLLRMKEGQRVTAVDVHNETDLPEQFHCHGQFVGTDVDGAGEEGTPFIAPHACPFLLNHPPQALSF